jgi:hypothetical protein
MKWLKTCPKSASYICQRISVAFGRVNNTQGGDHLKPQLLISANGLTNHPGRQVNSDGVALWPNLLSRWEKDGTSTSCYIQNHRAGGDLCHLDETAAKM